MFKYFAIIITSISLIGNCLAEPATLPEAPITPQENATEHDASYDALVSELNVRKKQHLVFCTATPDGLETIDAFLVTYPDSKHREQVLYLAALARWNLSQYTEAAAAYRNYLSEFPNERLSSLSMTRLAQSLIRSDQPAKAIEAIDEYKDAPAAEQREFHRADALALLGHAKEARIHVESIIMTMKIANQNERVIEVATQQLERLKMIGKPLQSFDKNAYATTRSVAPTSFKGKVLLIDFWAAWCRPCMNQMPDLVEIYSQYHDQGFEILGISLDSDEQAMTSALEKVGATWPQYFDGKKWKNDIAVLFDVHRIPLTILVDKEGIVQAVDPPPLAIKRLVGEQLAKK